MGSDADAVSVVDDRADELSSPQVEPTGSTTTAWRRRAMQPTGGCS